MFDIVSVGLNASSPRCAVQARSSLSRSLTPSNLPCEAASRRDERDEEKEHEKIHSGPRRIFTAALTRWKDPALKSRVFIVLS